MLNKKDQLHQLNKFKNPERYYVTKFVARAAKEMPVGSNVLDAGAGECVYKKYFKHCNYKSTDYCVGDDEWNYKHIDYICKLSEIPVADETFDYILCTQTLEHVPNPGEVIAELNRVLKKGGKLFLSAPFYHAEHQIPFDFYRYTQYGLKHLLGVNNFDKIKIEHGGGYLIVSGDIFKHIPALVFKHKLFFFIKWPMLVVTNIIYLVLISLDNNNKNKPNDPTFNYLVTTTKK